MSDDRRYYSRKFALAAAAFLAGLQTAAGVLAKRKEAIQAALENVPFSEVSALGRKGGKFEALGSLPAKQAFDVIKQASTIKYAAAEKQKVGPDSAPGVLKMLEDAGVDLRFARVNRPLREQLVQWLGDHRFRTERFFPSASAAVDDFLAGPRPAPGAP